MFRNIAVAIFALTLSSHANAAIVHTGDITTDQVTGYEWLNLTRTTSASVSSIQSQLDTIEGGGWQVATWDLINPFLSSAGLSFNNVAGNQNFSNTAQSTLDFLNIWGVTFSNQDFTQSWFAMSGPINGTDPIPGYNYNTLISVNNDLSLSLMSLGGSQSVSTSANFYTGIALVRGLPEISPVPIPAAIWLFGTALIGLVGFGKRRKAA